jgi:hypothetical protein
VNLKIEIVRERGREREKKKERERGGREIEKRREGDI